MAGRQRHFPDANSEGANPFRVLELIEVELAKLAGSLGGKAGQDERIFLKAEMAHLRTVKARLIRATRRRPPEAGLPVPSVPPRGPQPLQGGAAASLEFDE
jgi:hypothetical protein